MKISNFKFQTEIILTISIIAYVVLFSYLSINRYLSLNSHYFDLGIMDQVVYNSSKGRFLEMTNQDFKKNISRLAVHFDPILVVFAPFYTIYEDPRILLIVQTILLAVGAWLIYLIGLKVLKNKNYALIFAVSYLMFFPVGRANLFDFHAVTLATTFILCAIYFNLKRQNLLSFLFIALSLFTKENVGLVTFFWGLYLFFFRKERRFGLTICTVSITFFVAAVSYIIPYFRSQSHFALRYFGDFGDSPKKIIMTLLTNLPLLFRHLLTWGNATYLLSLLFAHLPLIVISPVEFLITAPELLINLLSSNANMKSIYFHYNSLMIPFIFLSCIYGLNKLIKSTKYNRYSSLILTVFMVANVLSFYLFAPYPIAGLKNAFWPQPLDKMKLEVLRKWQKKLTKDDLKVSTTPKIAPFFTARRYYYNFLFDPAYLTYGIESQDVLAKIDNYSGADYVIIDRSEFEKDDWDLPKIFYRHIISNKNFQKIYDNMQIEVYKKI